MSLKNQTPVEKIECLCKELVEHYGNGDDRELRVAAKLLLVALDQFRRHGGRRWPDQVREYLCIAEIDHEKWERIMRSNRSDKIETSDLATRTH